MPEVVQWSILIVPMRRSVVLPLLVIALLCACSNSEPSEVAVSTSPAATGTQADALTSEEIASMTIAEVLRSDARFSRFRDVVERVETPIAESVLAVWDWPAHQMGDNRDGVTVFAPTDAAFEKLDPAVLAVIEDPDIDNALLYSLFSLHYVHRLYPSVDFEPGDQRTWRNGSVQLGVDPLTWGGHPISETDLRTKNGIVHAVDGLVVPGELADAAGSS